MKLTPILVALIALIALPAWAGNVGFQQLTIADGSDKPLTIGVWYPTEAAATPQPLQAVTQVVAPGAPASGRGLPLVVISHGTGGWYGEHYDTALALAHAGFVVAALSHTSDTYDDQSRAARIWGRPEMLRRLVDYMLADWPEHGRIDATRVGVFGFSAGGFTALAAIGGAPDLGLVRTHCLTHPSAFECGVVSRSGAADPTSALPSRSFFTGDARIRAAVIVAPALGFTFGREGLKNVRVPVQLWRDEADHILPNPDYAQAVRDALPRPPEYHVVANADHFDFLAPCSDQLRKYAPDICVERPGFDRDAFHQQFDAEVVRFFERTLG